MTADPRSVSYDVNTPQLQYLDPTGILIPITTSGAGLPVGGSGTQVLSKINGTNFNCQWITPVISTFSINIKDYGAVGNGSTDDTAAIASALAALPAGGTLFVPYGTYKIIGSGSAIFTSTNNRAINILGEGNGSVFVIDSTVPNTRDIFYFADSSGAVGYSFRNFAVQGNGGTSGRHVIYFDTTAGTSTLSYNLRIENLIIQPTNGYSFYHKGHTSSTTGGLAYSTIRDSNMASLRFEYTGDSITLQDLTVSGTQQSLYFNQISGASNFHVIGGAYSGNGGMIECAGGVAPIFDGFQCETSATCTQAHNSMLDMTGAISKVVAPQFRNVQAQSLPSCGNPNILRLDNTSYPTIDGGRLSVAASYSHVVTTANCTDCNFGSLTQYVTNTVDGDLVITDAGTRTILPLNQQWTTYTPTVTSSGGTLGTHTGTGRYKIIGKTAFLQVKVVITANGTGAGNIQFTVPFTAKSDSYFGCRENASAAETGAGIIAAGASALTVLKYNGNYPGATGNTLVLSGFCEIQ